MKPYVVGVDGVVQSVGSSWSWQWYDWIPVIAGIIFIIFIFLNKFQVLKMWKQSGLHVFSLHPYLGRRWCEIAAMEEKKKAMKGRDYSRLGMTKEEITADFEEIWKAIREKLEDEVYQNEYARYEGTGYEEQAEEAFKKSMEKAKAMAFKKYMDNINGAAFKEFLQDLPVFCLSDNFFARFVRGMMSRGGARYQEVVLRDPSSVEDVYAFVRKVGDYFIYAGGIYLWPWKNQKRVQIWNIDDCRPVEDYHEDVQWENPRMNARYFWSIVNKVAATVKGDKDEGIPNWLIIGGLVVVVAAVGITWYMQHQQLQQLQDTVAAVQANFSRGR